LQRGSTNGTLLTRAVYPVARESRLSRLSQNWQHRRRSREGETRGAPSWVPSASPGNPDRRGGARQQGHCRHEQREPSAAETDRALGWRGAVLSTPVDDMSKARRTRERWKTETEADVSRRERPVGQARGPCMIGSTTCGWRRRHGVCDQRSKDAPVAQLRAATATWRLRARRAKPSICPGLPPHRFQVRRRPKG